MDSDLDKKLEKMVKKENVKCFNCGSKHFDKLPYQEYREPKTKVKKLRQLQSCKECGCEWWVYFNFKIEDIAVEWGL